MPQSKFHATSYLIFVSKYFLDIPKYILFIYICSQCSYIFIQCLLDIYKAMLKFTISFCRYSRLACENINNNSVVKQITHFSWRRKICITSNNPLSLLNPFVPTGGQWRLQSNIKRRSRLKKSQLNINTTKANKQMSDPVKPSLNHVSYGGQFDIAEEDDTTNQWRKQTENNKKKHQDIPPDFRIWETVGKNNISDKDGFKFKVMSYNVLAQYLLECHPYLYRECSPSNLKWNVRAAKIYDEILGLSPDILCLQEVQVSHLSSFYKKIEEMGYFGIFKQKTGNRQDGCAIYFKQSLFDMQDHISVEFYQPELPILNRDNIGLMVKLAPKGSPNTPLVVATTHLLYNPKRTDVRLAQLQVLLAEIDRFSFCHNGKEASHLPIILTGDFNSMPDSAVVQLLDRGHVSASSFRDNSDWKKIGVTDNCQHLSVYLNREKGVSTDFSMIKLYNSDYMDDPTLRDQPSSREFSELFNSGDIGHSLKLASVYRKVKRCGQLEATTYQDYWVTVDYIYFSVCNSLKLVERLRLPTAGECSVLGILPNDRYGSDHLALVATFQLLPRPTMSSL